MGDISENFNREEFACQCGCGFDTVDIELVSLCELVRELNGGSPLSPSSGCRCSSHNAKEGGSQNSQHVRGRGADIPVDNPKEVYKALCELYPGKYGFGLYHNRVHVDSRTNGPARWQV